MTASEAIDESVLRAVAAGNSVDQISTGWEKALEVVHMSKQLTMELRASLDADSRLRHWFTERTPQNREEEGYTDDASKVVISFPR